VVSKIAAVLTKLESWFVEKAGWLALGIIAAAF
jgi:hypothetical protein